MLFIVNTDTMVMPRNIIPYIRDKSRFDGNATIYGALWRANSAPLRDNRSKAAVSTQIWSYPLFPKFISGGSILFSGDAPRKLLQILQNSSRFSDPVFLSGFHLDDVLFTGTLNIVVHIHHYTDLVILGILPSLSNGDIQIENETKFCSFPTHPACINAEFTNYYIHGFQYKQYTGSQYDFLVQKNRENFWKKYKENKMS